MTFLVVKRLKKIIQHLYPSQTLKEKNLTFQPLPKKNPAIAATTADQPSTSGAPMVSVGNIKAKSGAVVLASKSMKDTNVYDKSMFAEAGMYTGQNARAIIECIECRKPRVIYSSSAAWCSRYKLELTILLSEHDYTCGSPITPPGHALHGKLFVRLEMSCASYIELSYYSTPNAIGNKPGLCLFCATDNTPRDHNLTLKFKTVLPVCETCKPEEWVRGYLLAPIWKAANLNSWVNFMSNPSFLFFMF